MAAPADTDDVVSDAERRPVTVAGPWWVQVPLVAVLGAFAIGKFGWTWFGVTVALMAFPIGLAAWTDLRTSRLPLWCTAGAAAVAAFGLSVTATAEGDFAPLVRAVVAVAALLVLGVLIGGLTGVVAFGDVLLGMPLAAVLAFGGWELGARAVFLLPVIALPAAVITLTRSRDRRARGALGPWMVLATVAALATA